jgi:hypothetical protein
MNEKVLAIPAAFLIFVLSAFGQAVDEPWKKAEISLCLGYGHAKVIGSTSYQLEWVPGSFPITGGDTLISIAAKDALYFGGLFSIFITRNFGFQTGFGYLKSDVPTEAAFSLTDARDTPVLKEVWRGTGEVTAVPLCLNLAGRVSLGKFKMSMSAGGVLFLNSFFADSYAGTAVASPLSDEVFDVFRIKIVIEDKTWSALGGNIGGSVELRISGGLALTAEARVFFCPTRSFAWRWIPGEYPGLFGSIPRWNLDQESASSSESRARPISINPSFATIGIGIKFLR